MITTVVGGALLPHAPQFFTLPPTEDRATVERVRATAAEIGSGLRELKPDLWIIFSNDHAEQFFHAVAPPFTIHVGAARMGTSPAMTSSGRSRERSVWNSSASSTAKASILPSRARRRSTTPWGFRSAISATPIPSCRSTSTPTSRRSRPWRAAMRSARRLRASVTALGLRTVVLASGGMSHFPGTDRYSNPELDWDRTALARIAAGNLKSLIGYDEDELDDKGNIELRCWACAAGALGERKPDIVSLDPSWHHNYASVAWFGGGAAPRDLHYPSIRPELVGLTTALHGLAHEASARADFRVDANGFAARFPLSPDQSRALVLLDVPALVTMGVHPLVAFLANMQVQRERAEKPS